MGDNKLKPLAGKGSNKLKPQLASEALHLTNISSKK